MSSMLEPNWRSCEKIATVIGWVSRPKVSATSRSFHVHRNWKIASEAIAGRPSGRISLKKMPQLRGAVDPRRLEDVLRDPDEEVAQQEDRERQPERDVEQHQPEHGVEQAGCRCRARRSGSAPPAAARRAAPTTHEEQPVAARELEPGERVAGERGDEDQQDGVADGDLQRW